MPPALHCPRTTTRAVRHTLTVANARDGRRCYYNCKEHASQPLAHARGWTLCSPARHAPHSPHAYVLRLSVAPRAALGGFGSRLSPESRSPPHRWECAHTHTHASTHAHDSADASRPWAQPPSLCTLSAGLRNLLPRPAPNMAACPPAHSRDRRACTLSCDRRPVSLRRVAPCPRLSTPRAPSGAATR